MVEYYKVVSVTKNGVTFVDKETSLQAANNHVANQERLGRYSAIYVHSEAIGDVPLNVWKSFNA